MGPSKSIKYFVCRVQYDKYVGVFDNTQVPGKHVATHDYTA